MFGKSFCDQNLLRAPGSEYVGLDAWLALSFPLTRQSLWYCTENEFRCIQRTDVRSLVLEGSSVTPWACYVTTNYKKHGSLVTPINNSRFGRFRFESVTVDCRDNQKVLNWYNKINDAAKDGIGRSVIETLDCPVYMLPKIGIDRWKEFQDWARPIYKSPLFQFLCYLLPSQEERKKEVA